MTNSALATEQDTSIKKIKGVMTSYLQQLDNLLNDNFKLKTEIANEKKRYLDLMSAFIEIRNQQKFLSTDLLNSENS